MEIHRFAIIVVITTGIIAGCDLPGKTYDPKLIAAEADAGNLKPVRELLEECDKEIAKDSTHKTACAAMNKVRSIRTMSALENQRQSNKARK